MVAIAGVVYPRILPGARAVEAALAALADRSPAEPEIYLHKQIEIGARGEPLAFNERRTLCAAVDADLLEVEQLCMELTEAGCPVNNANVGELILHAYDVWDLDFVSHLHGAFAIAISDLDKGEVILARDRLGIKPLYWSYHNDFLLFASQLKALLATGIIPQSAAPEGIASYLFLGYLPQDLTPIEDVNKLLPGGILRFSRDRRLQVETYWKLDQLLGQERNCDDLEEELGQALGRTFARRVHPGQKMGYVGTGDLPSSLMGSYLGLQSPSDQLYALSVDYAQQNVGEVAAASQLGHEVRTATVTPQTLLDELIPTVWHLDEPIAHPAAIGIWRLCQLSKQLDSSLYVDLGAEEVLLGPPEEALSPPRSDSRSKVGMTLLHRILFPVFRALYPRGAFQLLRRANANPWLDDYAAKHALFPHDQLRAMSPALSRSFDPDIFLRRMLQQSELGAGRDAHLYLEARTILTDEDILVFERLSTASGLACHAPFLDHRLIELIASLNSSCRAQIGQDDFALLRRLGGVPPNVAPVAPYRKSASFLNNWIHDGAIQRTFRHLLNGSLVESGWVSRDWIAQALGQRLQPPATFQQLWSILNLEVWHRLYINRPIATPTMSLTELLR
jgi:asparagine synthase (glutamine-hydrolysing)